MKTPSARGSNSDISVSNKITPNTQTLRENLNVSHDVSSPSLIDEDQDITLTPCIQSTLSDSNRTETRTITVSANGLDKIFKEVRKLREEIKEVKGLLKQTRNITTVSCLPDIPVEFPLESIANLQTLEEYLNSQEDSSNDLASYFSTLGGNGIPAQVNRILRMVMSDFLATHYNFAGQRNKQAFGNTKLVNVIIRAIQIKSPSTTTVVIENAVKTWLKHAKQRMEKKHKQGQKFTP